MRIHTLPHPVFNKMIIASFCAFFFLLIQPSFASHRLILNEETGKEYSVILDCDNVTNGGLVDGNEAGYANPFFDPSLITNVELPSGGSGDLQYLWIMTTDNPVLPFAQWSPISGSNTAEYDPSVITQTTYFMRCARRSDCVDYVGESNYITKTVLDCDNVTSGGLIAMNQTGQSPFNPQEITNLVTPSGGSGDLEYLWFESTVGPPYIDGSPNWSEVPNFDTPNFDPGILTQTTYYIRCVRRSECEEYVGESNIVTITVTETTGCDNVLTGGTVGFNQEGEAPFTANEITNISFPTGGTGELEYLWFFSTVTDIYIEGSLDWILLPNSNSPNYDPGVLTQTTYFIRCVRRSGCEDYNGETNVITILVNENEDCDNVLTGGTISDNQTSCFSFVPAPLVEETSPTGGTGDLEYLWFVSTTGTDFSTISGDWSEIPNTNTVNYSPEEISETSYFIRCVRRTNCSNYLGKSNMVSIIVNPTLNVDVAITQEVLCFGEETAAIDLTISGGVEPYSFSWSSDIGDVEDPENLGGGNYSVTVTDANNCAAVEMITILEPSPLNLSFMVENTSCPNSSDGALTVMPMSGVFPYTYLWSDAAAQTTATATNLSVGSYTVTVIDANNCDIGAAFDVDGPADIFTILPTITNASCGNQSDGAASILVSEEGDYSIIWNDANFTTGNTLSDVPAGIYTVSVTSNEENGCTVTENITIGTNPSDILVNINTIGETCPNAGDGTAIATATEGAEPYTYLWSDANAQTTESATDLSVGVYHVTVTDATGCTAIQTAEIQQGEGIIITSTVQHISCNGENDAFIVVNPSNGLAPYTYEWSNINSSNGTVTGLTPGNYVVTVTDALGCMGTAGFEILAPGNLTVTVSAEDVTCSDDLGTITTSAFGGFGPMTYEWSNGSNTPDLVDVLPGTYSVTVTDVNNCEVISEATINATITLNPLVFTTDVTCNGENDGSANVVGDGGVEPYSYLWNTDATTEAILDLFAGVYVVTVTDASSCSFVQNVEIEEPNSLDLSIEITTEISANNAADGGLDGTVIGGTEPYSYLWSNGETTPTLSGLSGGIYTVTVTDSNGCSEETTITLVEPENLTVSIGDYVWYDANGDGIQQSYEQGAGGIEVYLISTETNQIIGTQITNSSGFYQFTDIEEGEYIVEFVVGSLPNNFIITQQNQSTNDAVDSDANSITGQTEPFTVIISQGDITTIDAGIVADCINVTSGGTIAANQNVCNFEIPDLITGVSLPLGGGTGNYEYLWLQGLNPQYIGIGDPNWTAIPDTNTPDYQPSTLAQTTYFIRCARNVGCDEYTGESNIVEVNVVPVPYINIITTPSAVCYNEGNTFEASQSGGGASYAWDFGLDAEPQTASTREVNGVTWTSPGSKTITLIVTRFGCTSTEEHTLDATNCFNLTGQFEGFSAIVLENRKVSLNWQTTTEDSQSIFFVENSTDGVNFETIGTVQGKQGTTYKTYQFDDFNPYLGMNQYRIRQVRSSGIYGVSQIETALVIPENTPEIVVYPNPVEDRFTVQVILPQDEALLVQFISSQGNILESQLLESTTVNQEFDISDYPSGLYFVQIYYRGNHKIIEKLIKK